MVMAESFLFWRRRISQTDSYRDYNDSAATHNVSDRKKRLSAKKKAESFFFGTETKSSRAESYVIIWFRQCTLCLRPKKTYESKKVRLGH
jgi:hypothetical protein